VGSAAIAGTALRLTPSFMGGQAGAVEWNVQRPLVAIDARFSFRIDQDSVFDRPGDGLVFVWTAGTVGGTIGGSGGALGACFGGLTGYGLAVDTYPSDAYLRLIRLPDCQTLGQSTEVDSLADGVYRTLRVQVSATGAVVVSSGGNELLTHTIAAYAPYVGFVGFTAGTGGAVS
jgi:hypothetical protein